MSRFVPGDRVYYTGNLFTVMEGLFRTLEYPEHDMYNIKAGNGARKGAWATDLMSVDEFHGREDEEK